MKIYEAPEIEIIPLNITDVISASDGTGGDSWWGDGGYLPGA